MSAAKAARVLGEQAAPPEGAVEDVDPLDSPLRGLVPQAAVGAWREGPERIRALVVEEAASIREGFARLDLEGPDSQACIAMGYRLRALAQLGDSLRIAEVVATADDQVVLPVLDDDVSPGGRVRALREALGLTVAEVAATTGLGASTIDDIEHDRQRRHRPRVATVLAEGLESCLPGRIDAGSLRDLLVASWAHGGLLAPAGDWDDQWMAKRRAQAIDGAEVRRQSILRRAHQLAREAAAPPGARYGSIPGGQEA